MSNQLEDELRSPGHPVFFSKRAIASIPWLLAARVTTFFLYLIASVLMVRGLGAHNYGVYSLCKTIATYFVAVCGLGLNVAVLRFVPETLIRGQTSETRRLFFRAGALQVVAALFCIVVAYPFSETVGQTLKIPFHVLFFPTWALLVGLLLKSYLSDALTSVYLSRDLAKLSLLQAILWLAGLGVLFGIGYSVTRVLWIQIFSLFIIGALGLTLLIRFSRQLDEATDRGTVAGKRILALSFPVLISSILNQLTMRYTELLFLGVYFSPVIVSYYELGYFVPHILITFFPFALHTLFTSAFAEAFTKDQRCLPRLMRGLYQIIITFSVPVACFGLFFLPRAITLVYGQELAPAGKLAAAFAVIHLLPLMWGPLSMAVTAKEKNLQTLWLQFLQVGINIVLDFILIPTYGLWGAVLAVVSTFFITLPVQLYVIHRLIGGIHFPIAYFVRLFVPSLLVAGILAFLVPEPSLATLFALVVVFCGLLIGLVRGLRVIRAEDVENFRSVDLPLVHQILNFLR